jgi:hypothetical protein
MREVRLGDIIDDYCVKCKRLTNHATVSLMNDQPAKVRCCSCYKEHDFTDCVVPPTKRELKMMQLAAEALAEAEKAK